MCGYIAVAYLYVSMKYEPLTGLFHYLGKQYLDDLQGVAQFESKPWVCDEIIREKPNKDKWNGLLFTVIKWSQVGIKFYLKA